MVEVDEFVNVNIWSFLQILTFLLNLSLALISEHPYGCFNVMDNLIDQ